MLFLPAWGKELCVDGLVPLRRDKEEEGNNVMRWGENEAMSSALPTIHTYVSLPLIDNLNLVCLTVDS
jgi:hypothetical protein